MSSARHTIPGPVLLLCPTLFSVRNVLHSRMLPTLERLGLRAHVLAGAALGAPPATGPKLLLSTLDVLQRASFYRRFDLASDRITLWWYRRNDSPWQRGRFAAVESLAVVGSRSPLYEWQLARMAALKRRVWDLTPARDAIERLQPSVVVATSCISPAEEPFLMAARDLGIPTLGCIQSFDHLTGRSLPADCDHYAVWNDRMRDQLAHYHGVRDASRVHVTGTAQFDFHRQDEFRWTRARTLAELGLRPEDRYILYAANTRMQTPSEPGLVAHLASRCADVPELRSHRIVVRLHPLDTFERWDGIAGASPRVVISRPSARSESFDDPADQARLVSTQLHADVCHNMWSSMSLDASVVDTPVVCVAFADRKGTAEDRFCQMVYETDYYQPIVESGGVRVARNMDQLVAETAAYVADPARDREARARLARQECGPLDGRSAERIAELIDALTARRPALQATA